MQIVLSITVRATTSSAGRMAIADRSHGIGSRQVIASRPQVGNRIRQGIVMVQPESKERVTCTA